MTREEADKVAASALAELIRRGTRNDETARHTIVLRLNTNDVLLLAAILRDAKAAAEAAWKENDRG